MLFYMIYTTRSMECQMATNSLIIASHMLIIKYLAIILSHMLNKHCMHL